MKKTFTLTLVCVAFVFSALKAQKQNFTLLFDYKTSALTAEHDAQLKSTLAAFNPDSVTIKIDAYCDSVGGPDYNVGLGGSRGNNVQRFFTSNKVKSKNITVVNHGSENPTATNATEEGRKLNRRVLVEIISTKKGAKIVTVVINQDSINAANEKMRCSRDTTVNLPNGVILKMGRCEFEKIQSCMLLNVYNTSTMLRKSGYSTNGPQMINLETVAIVDVKLCADTNLKTAMKIYIPTGGACLSTKPIDLWKGYSKMMWQNRGEAAKKETVDGKEYYVFETFSSVSVNFASDTDVNPMYTFKAKKGLKFTEIRVSYDCGMGVYIHQSATAVKKMKFTLPCAKGDVYFEVYGVDKAGKQVRLDYTSSSKIKSKSKQKVCKDGKLAKKFTFFPDAFAN